MLYFAYGSNMSPRQMAARCPGAQSIGAAKLQGWRFIMTARGSANIVQEPRAQVHGVLWRCEPWHLAELDRWEGVRLPNYRRRMVNVTPQQAAPELSACEQGGYGQDATGQDTRRLDATGQDVIEQSANVQGVQVSAVTYISSRIYRGQARAHYLLSAVLPGARAFQLPAIYLDELATWSPRRPIGAAAGRFSNRYVGRRR